MNGTSIDIGHVVVDGLAGNGIDGLRLGQMADAALQGMIERQGLPGGLANAEIGDLASLWVNLPHAAGEAQIAEALGIGGRSVRRSAQRVLDPRALVALRRRLTLEERVLEARRRQAG